MRNHGPRVKIENRKYIKRKAKRSKEMNIQIGNYKVFIK